jgi:hypothetical protein
MITGVSASCSLDVIKGGVIRSARKRAGVTPSDLCAVAIVPWTLATLVCR